MTRTTSDQSLAGVERLLGETPLLDFSHPRITALVESWGWDDPDNRARLQEIHDYVRDDVLFGYNREELIPASEVLGEGFGQCNTKGILFMALLRRCGFPCRFHAFTIDKRLQAGVIPPGLYKRLPDSLQHSWVEVLADNEWLSLEGFILDARLLSQIQSRFASWNGSFCGFAVACDDLHHPQNSWTGAGTYVQHRAINGDLGTFDSPDDFYRKHAANVSGLKKLLWRRAWYGPTNRNVEAIRSGQFPEDAQQFVQACPT